MANLTRIPIAMVGEFGEGTKNHAISNADLGWLVADFRKRKSGEMAIEYEDAATFPEEQKQGLPRPVAGHLKELAGTTDAKGILWGKAEFTPRALEMIRAKKYKYLVPSMMISRDASGKQQGLVLTGVTLVNSPSLEAMSIPLSESLVSRRGLGMTFPLSESLDLVEHELDWLVRQKMAQRSDQSYGTALKLVASENPELIRRKVTLQRQRDYGY